MQSPLFGRRIHITGSIDKDSGVASAESVEAAREFITELVKQLMQKGATFVVPVDAEPLRESDNLPKCFDWLVWETINSNLAKRPSGAPMPLAMAVQHHKTEEQIPEKFHDLWDDLRGSDFVKIENAAEWNMASKRMEAQARWGDILIAVGGDEGVLYLANLYHEAGKPVIPLNLALCEQGKGARKLFSYGLNSGVTKRLFNTGGAKDAHTWLNLINFPKRKPTSEGAPILIDLLESLNRPKAFAVRLLNPEHPDFVDVQNFFETVVEPVVSEELGYDLVTIDADHVYENASVVQEIFGNLHRSSIVIADITGMRPNCFIELGYALGRNIPTALTAKNGTEHPFDVSVFSGHHWKTGGVASDKQKNFRRHWEAIKNRSPLVPTELLMP
ncbi:MAG: hypothetical protein DHS20C02_11020 [Micavibrio sp.]|nr:MAG: hypothetical protein DHS20C02_11020 [Micavibrio sp.]